MKVKVINKSPNALPAYETENSAGMDLRAWHGEGTTEEDTTTESAEGRYERARRTCFQSYRVLMTEVIILSS